MDKVSNFYNNLFNIEITVFGILIAAIFVIVRLVHSSFSYKPLTYIFKNGWFIFYFVISIFSLISIVGINFLLSLERHNFIPQYNFYSRETISNPWVMLTSLGLFFFSIIVFMFLIYKNIQLLSPSEVVLRFSKNLKYEEVRQHLLKKYGVPAPLKVPQFSPAFKNLLQEFENGSNKKNSVNSSEENEDIKEKKAIEQYEKDYAKYEKLTEQVKNSTDPFNLIVDIGVQAIKQNDFMTLREVKESLIKISQNFFITYPELSSIENWTPDSKIREYYIENLLSICGLLLEVSEKESMTSTKLIILEISENLGDLIVDSPKAKEKEVLFNFWKRIADRAIGKDPEVFKKIISFFNSYSNKLFDKGEEDLLKDIFRALGWLGERLLTKTQVEDRPLMAEYEHTTEYDELVECILSASSKYNDLYPDWYPLIYFDAVDVLLRKLIIQVKDHTRSYDLENQMFNFTYVFSSFAEKAIKAKNRDGAELAVMRLNLVYELFEKNGLKTQAEDCIKLLTYLALLASGYGEDIGKSSFLGKPIEDWITDKIVSSNYTSAIGDEILNSYIKLRVPKQNDVWLYIKKLGGLLNTNFNFRFDPITGEDYPRKKEISKKKDPKVATLITAGITLGALAIFTLFHSED